MDITQAHIPRQPGKMYIEQQRTMPRISEWTVATFLPDAVKLQPSFCSEGGATLGKVLHRVHWILGSVQRVPVVTSRMDTMEQHEEEIFSADGDAHHVPKKQRRLKGRTRMYGGSRRAERKKIRERMQNPRQSTNTDAEK